MMDFLALDNQAELLQGAGKAEPEKPTKDAGKAEKELAAPDVSWEQHREKAGDVRSHY